MRELWLKLLLVGFGCAFALASAEAALRVVSPPPAAPEAQVINPTGLHQKDEVFIHRLGANVSGTMVRPEFTVEIETNSLGLRDEEVGPKADDEFRILAIGDSFTFGYGVEAGDSWVELLGRVLNRTGATARRVNVINAGVSGYGTLQEALVLEKLIEPMQPDLVLVGFHSENDIYDNLAFLDIYKNLFAGGIAWRLREYTRLFPKVESIVKRLHYAMIHGRAVRITFDAIEDIVGQCEAAGADLAFVMVPPQPWRLVVSDALGEGWWAQLRRTIRWDPRFEHHSFVQGITALGPPVYDPLEMQEAQPDPEPLFYYTNGHWRPAMHGLVARQLAEFLVAEQLIDVAEADSGSVKSSAAGSL